jgi:hypothetical protein
VGKVTVYGASDDLIEVEGDISEEFTPGEDESAYFAFSDGTVLFVEYAADGFWRIHRRANGTAAYEKHEGTDPDDDYSDRVTLDGVSWVVIGSRFERASA